jgi:hypothetical protein
MEMFSFHGGPKNSTLLSIDFLLCAQMNEGVLVKDIRG